MCLIVSLKTGQKPRPFYCAVIVATCFSSAQWCKEDCGERGGQEGDGGGHLSEHKVRLDIDHFKGFTNLLYRNKHFLQCLHTDTHTHDLIKTVLKTYFILSYFKPKMNQYVFQSFPLAASEHILSRSLIFKFHQSQTNLDKPCQKLVKSTVCQERLLMLFRSLEL